MEKLRFMGCSGLQICQKCFGGRGSAPEPIGGGLYAPHTSYSGADGGGARVYAPKPWIKNKIQLRVMHIDTLVVAIINDHKTRDVARHWLGGLSAHKLMLTPPPK